MKFKDFLFEEEKPSIDDIKRKLTKLKKKQKISFSINHLDMEEIRDFSVSLRQSGYGTYISSGKLSIQKL